MDILDVVAKLVNGNKRKHLKRLKCFFTSDVDFTMFIRFVNKNTIAKRVGNYVSLVKTQRRKTNNRFLTEENEIKEHRYYAILGINDDSKIFFNLLNFEFNDLSDLGFTSESKIISELNNAYRVQGDLVFITNQINEEEIRNELFFELKRIIERSFRLKISEYLSIFLSNKRISHRILNTNPTKIEIAITRMQNKEKIRDAMAMLLCEFIKEVEELYPLRISYEIIPHSPYGLNVTLIDVTLYVDFDAGMYKATWEKTDEILKSIMNSSAEHQIYFGNHLIIYNGVPTKFKVSFRLFDVEVNDEIEILNDIIIPKVNSDIKIIHNEHGETIVKVLIPTMIRLANTNVSDRDSLWRNKLILEQYY